MWCRKAKKADHETEEKQACVYTKDATDEDEREGTMLMPTKHYIQKDVGISALKHTLT